MTGAIVTLPGRAWRRGEATAMTWADVDLDARTISVTKSWEFAAGRVKGPKTAAGERVVHIPQLLTDFLAWNTRTFPSRKEFALILTRRIRRKRWRLWIST